MFAPDESQENEPPLIAKIGADDKSVTVN